jgi:hemerythrin-like metal-binding protein
MERQHRGAAGGWAPPAGRWAELRRSGGGVVPKEQQPIRPKGTMPLFDWKPALDLGVAAMDREHKELVAAMNEIHDLDRKGADKPTLDTAIQKLIGLTKKHFADEEKHMAAIGYPDGKRHALIHVDMLRKVAVHYDAFTKGSGRVSPEFFDFLVFWLNAHITGIDKKYATHRTPVKA